MILNLEIHKFVGRKKKYKLKKVTKEMIRIFMSGVVGNVETKEVNGKYVMTMSVVSNDYYGGKKVSTWLTVQKWNPGNLVKYIEKGITVVVEGSYSSYKSVKTGKDYVVVLAGTVNFYGKLIEGGKVEDEEDEGAGAEQAGWEHLNNVGDPF